LKSACVGVLSITVTNNHATKRALLYRNNAHRWPPTRTDTHKNVS